MRSNVKPLYAALVLACASFAAVAQQREPQIGGAPVDTSGVEMREGRRQVMRQTLERQYTEREIDEYRRAINGYERSKSGVYDEAAKVVRRRVSVNLTPDADVPELRLNAENVGAIVFTDSFGSPWPIADVIAPGFVAASKSENIVIFRPNAGQGASKPFGRSSVTVLLEGLTSTVTFSLSYGLSREVDGQIEAQVQARNPSATVSAVRGGAVETDDAFGLFLDGEPPKGATAVKTTSKSVSAWMYRGRLYVRTPLSLHSPAFRMYGGSATGVNMYSFDRVPSVINAIHDGSIVAVGIGE